MVGRGDGAATQQDAAVPGKRSAAEDGGAAQVIHASEATQTAGGIPAEQAVAKAEAEPVGKLPKPQAGAPAGAGLGDEATPQQADAGPTAPATPAAPTAPAPTVTHQTTRTAPSAPDTRLRVGVGEAIDFTSSVAGGWAANSVRAGQAATATGTTYQWHAPSTAGSANITFTPTGGTAIVKAVTVVAPTLAYLNPRASAFPGQAAGVAGVQMVTDVTYTPDDVSFANTNWWEQPGPASGATGAFVGATLPYHHPNPSDLPIQTNNSGITDSAGFWGFTPNPATGAYTPGSFRWRIPTYYKVNGDASRIKLLDVDQTCQLAADGTVTVTKLGGTLSRTP